MGKHKPPREIFAISKSYNRNPLILDYNGTTYTKHFLHSRKYKGKARWVIVDVELTKEEALTLIEQNNMSVAQRSNDGIIWDTTPSLRSECQRLGLTYTHNRSII